MKKGLTEIVFILDASGSMQPLRADTIGGFNSLIEKQKKEDGEALISAVTFSDSSRVIYDRVPLSEIESLDEEKYCPAGSTALFDAVGSAVKHIGNIHKYARKEDIPEKTLFVITTDGMENASRHYSGAEVRKIVKRQQEKYGWEFLFLGANIDAASAAEDIGISSGRAANYEATADGCAVQYEAMCCAVASVRKGRNLSEETSWRESLDR